MSAETEILNYGAATLASGAAFTFALAYLVKTVNTIYLSHKGTGDNAISKTANISDINTAEIRRLTSAVTNCKEVLTAVSGSSTEHTRLLEGFSLQLASIESGENDIKREVDIIYHLADNLVNTHADPNSNFATVGLRSQVDDVIKAVQRVEVKVAELKK